MITLFTAFIIKHFICDFLLQRWPYMYTNKGNYMHIGGVLHAHVHALGTVIVFWAFNPSLALPAAAIDLVAHYHIDWAKMKLCNKYNLKPDNSEWYWHLLGLDQMLHYLTYLGIILWA